MKQARRIEVISKHISSSNSKIEECERSECLGKERDLNDQFEGPWKEAHAKWGNSKVIAEYFFNGRLPVLMEEWRDKYGKIFRFINYELDTKMLRDNIIVADIKEYNRLLKENIPKTDAYSRLRLLGEGILSQYDQKEWARHREIIKPVFAADCLRQLVPVMESGSKEMLQIFAEHSDSQTSFDFHDVMSNIAFEMIGHSALGEESEFLKKNAKHLRESFETLLIKGYEGQDINQDQEFKEADKFLKDFSSQVFERYSKSQSQCPFHEAGSSSKQSPNENKKKLNNENPTAISVIVGNDENGNPNFTENQKYDQLSTFMFAGHETTANTISWIIIELARNQRVQNNLREEIFTTKKQLGISAGQSIKYQDLFKFQYLTLVINEALRLWPVVAMGTIRELHEDTMIDGKIAQKGTVIRFPIYLIHRDKDYWGPDADKFIPERKWNSEAFLPFSKQPRDCLGRNLALLEMRVFLIEILSNFCFELANQEEEISGFEAGTMRPRHGAKILPKRLTKTN